MDDEIEILDHLRRWILPSRQVYQKITRQEMQMPY